MIIGIGNDLVAIERIAGNIERHGMRFVARCFSPVEIKRAESRPAEARASTYAKRFAAKEAAAKALGTGFRDGLFLKDISVCNDEAGKPTLILNDEAAARLARITPDGMTPVIHVSLSDDKDFAQAFVVIEALPQEK